MTQSYFTGTEQIATTISLYKLNHYLPRLLIPVIWKSRDVPTADNQHYKLTDLPAALHNTYMYIAMLCLQGIPYVASYLSIKIKDHKFWRFKTHLYNHHSSKPGYIPGKVIWNAE